MDALSELASMLYHRENPIDALSKLLAYQILGLFDQPLIPDSLEVLIKIKSELVQRKEGSIAVGDKDGLYSEYLDIVESVES